MSIDQIIQWELNNEIITHPPGSSYVYLNFGYILLTRIIEKLDEGLIYEKFVQSQVFTPCGITGMQIGKNDLNQRLEYYGSSAGGNPYGLHLERMQGNGGWVMVMNTRAEKDTYAWTLDGILGNLYSSVTWPAYSLF